jgi:hypothetical protein
VIRTTYTNCGAEALLEQCKERKICLWCGSDPLLWGLSCRRVFKGCSSRVVHQTAHDYAPLLSAEEILVLASRLAIMYHLALLGHIVSLPCLFSVLSLASNRANLASMKAKITGALIP